MLRKSPEITENLLSLIHEGEQVLDVGCGDAALLKRLSERGLSLHGVDPAFKESGLPEVPNDIHLLPGSAERIPFPDSSFDTVVMQCVFSLCRPEDAVSEVCRVLKSGGRLILSDLYSDVQEICLRESSLLGIVYLKEHLEQYFTSAFRCLRFADLTPALTEMIVEAIWLGKEERCGSCGDLALLRRIRARYGLWVWEKLH